MYRAKPLRRTATRLAEVSAGVMAKGDVARRVARLTKLMASERASKLAQGDLLVQLIDEHGLRPIDIARRTKQRPADLSQMYHTCRTFPPKLRRKNVPYTHYLMAAWMVRRFKTMKLDPLAVLAEIRAMGFTQNRQVTAHFAAKAARMAAGEAEPLPQGDGWFDRAYHAPFQSLLNVIADGAIKVLHVDPPYVYRNSATGQYRGASAKSLDCDNRDGDDAAALVVDLVRDWQPKLAPGGVLLLWQPSGPMPPSIMTAIEQHAWAIDRVVVWDKGRPQAGDLAGAYQTQCEWLWVLKRPGDRLVNHDDSARGDVIRFAPASHPSTIASQHHGFEKPIELCRFLVGKHSHPGELVADFCGCTGSMSVAAIEQGRRWAYVESNAANYALGTSRIAGCLGSSMTAAG